MNVFSNIWQILQKPFPEDESDKYFFRNTLFISVFVALFLYIFQPFGMSGAGPKIFLVCLGFGAVTFVASVIYEFVVIRLLAARINPGPYTFGKWIMGVIGLILFIGIANFLFARLLFFGNIHWEYLPTMIYATFAVGVFPAIIIGWVALLRQESKYQTIAEEINQNQTGFSEVAQAKDATIFDIPVANIRYIEALQNYVKIGYVNTSGQLIEQTERATLKSILDLLGESPIVQCHRSFLVNQQTITSTSGNAQGLLLSLADCDKVIPVSRSYVASFRSV